MGRVKFVVFYLLGGIAALLGQIVIDPNAVVPTLGTSGAVAGVLGGYLLLYPRGLRVRAAADQVPSQGATRTRWLRPAARSPWGSSA